MPAATATPVRQIAATPSRPPPRAAARAIIRRSRGTCVRQANISGRIFRSDLAVNFARRGQRRRARCGLCVRTAKVAAEGTGQSRDLLYSGGFAPRGPELLRKEPPPAFGG